MRLITFLIPLALFGLFVNAQNVGIGTTTPQMKLHVSSPSDTALLLIENQTALASNVNTGLYFKTGPRYTGAIKTIGTSAVDARMGFFTYSTFNQNTFKEYMSISDNGNVGIGTIANSAALVHINTGTQINKCFVVTGSGNSTAQMPNLGFNPQLLFVPGLAAIRAGVPCDTCWNTANTGYSSVALGYGCTASGLQAVSMGASNTAGGDYSIAIGFLNYASGSYAVALGQGNRANGSSSFATGSTSYANGLTSTAMGNFSRANGTASTAMGTFSVADADFSTAIGANTRAEARLSTAMGYYTVSRGLSSMTVGMFNDPILFSAQTATTPATPLFTVGNGDDNNNRSNALVVQKDGSVGVGNITPEFKLDVDGRMRLRSSGGNTSGVWFNSSDNYTQPSFIGNANNSYVGFYGNTGAGWGLGMNTTNGNVGIGTLTPSQKLQVVGNICATGSIGSCSDIRYKTAVAPLTGVLPSVLALQPIRYNWKTDFQGYTPEKQLGFSAQEVETYFPEIVATDAQGYKSVDYSRMSAVLLEAVKEQQAVISKLEERLNALEQKLSKEK